VHLIEVLQFLVPGVQHAKEAHIGPEAFRIACDFEECCGAGAEPNVVDTPLVLQCQRSHFVGQVKTTCACGR
jgi:hypothetical protein